MPIQDGDVKLLESERMHDASDGGGRVTGNVIIDGESNNIFPDISELDRTYGRVNLRKVFSAVHTDDTDSYYGAHMIIADGPDDPRVSATLFSTRSWTDTRAEAVSRMEAYLARGPKFDGYLWDQHLAGQKALLVLIRTDRQLPPVGSVLVVTKNPGQPTEENQYVRITKVNSETVSFTGPSPCGTYTRQKVTLEISDPLAFDVLGGTPHCNDDIGQNIPSRLYTTVVADASKYYGIAPLAEAVSVGALSARVESIFTPIVPTAQVEIPIADAKPHQDSINPTAASGAAVSFTTGVTLSPTQALYVGQGIYPGSLAITAGSATLTDLGGRLMAGTTEIGAVDYANGIVSVSSGGPTYTGSKTVSFVPAAMPARAMQTWAMDVTQESRSQTVVALLDPIPAPGTLAVHYRAQGRWYMLRDDGSGALRGTDASYGSGNVNFASGSVIATLGALPDVGTVVLLTYGVKALEMVRDGISVKAYMDIDLSLTDGISPSSITIAWGSGLSATDDGFGNLSGDATGTVSYAAKRVRFEPNVIPDGGAEITLQVSTREAVSGQAINPTYTATEASFSIADVVPGSLRLSVRFHGVNLVLFYGKWRHVYNGHETLLVVDDGLGALKVPDGRTVGSINYATGAVILYRELSLAVAADVYKRSTYRGRTTDTFTLTAAGEILADYIKDTTPISQPPQIVTWAPKIDLTPGYAEDIVPGSVRLSFAGKTVVDRTGKLYMDVNPANGSGTECGTVDYVSGVCTLTAAAIPGQPNSGTVRALLTSLYGHPVLDVTFRTAASPVRPGTLILQFARPGGGTETVSAASNGVISGTNVLGTVDYESGIVRVRFGEWVTAAGNESEWWYDPDDIRPDGKIFRPAHILAETLRYACLAYAHIPLDASVLGLNPVRLPSDGRVPIFRGGDVAVLHHTKRTTGTWSNGQTVNLGRTRIARVRVFDANGGVVGSARYSVDLDDGLLTWVDVSGLTQPLTIEDRIEDMALVSDVQISGHLSFTRQITHDYPVPGSFVSSALIIGDMSARYTNLFEQATWTGVWSDSLIGSEPTASFNEVQYPIQVTNRGAIQERWAIIFTNSTSFRVVGQSVGEIATGNISTNLAPINPATGVPYFTLNALGWGGGWAAGNVLRFNTVAANYPVWVARTIQQGPVGEEKDSFTLQIRGDMDA